MNQQFEVLPFAGESGQQESEGEWEGEWEGERDGQMEEERGRGGRGGGRGLARPVRGGRPGGGPRPPPGRPPGPGRWPRPPKYWPRYPVYGGGGWPYPVPAYPYPEPPPEPDQEPPPEFDDGAGEGELPASVKKVLQGMPTAPKYVSIGMLPDAVQNAKARAAGLYMIVFKVGHRLRAYSGHSKNVARRLRQHLLCARMLGIPATDHRVYMAAAPNLNDDQRRDVERRIHTEMLRNHQGVLTNQNRELEAELFGEV